MRLYTFNISHFAEKARWALDRTGIRYQERVLLPGPHIPTMRRLRQGATSVPALVDEGLHPMWHVFPGPHEAEYWIEHVPDYLRFYGGALRT